MPAILARLGGHARALLQASALAAICIVAVYLIVNKTKLGLLLRATTQNRQMAAALGVGLPVDEQALRATFDQD